MAKTTHLRNFWVSLVVLLCVFWARLFLAVFHSWPLFYGGEWQIVVSRWWDVLTLPLFVFLALSAFSFEGRRVAARKQGKRHVSSVPLVLLFLGTAYGALFGFTFPVVVGVATYSIFCLLRSARERIVG